MPIGTDPQYNTVGDKFRGVSFEFWLKGIFWVCGLLIAAGIWYQNNNTSAEILSDRISSLSLRITTLEDKQARAISDIGEIKSTVMGINKDLNFLAQTIQAAGVDRDRQLGDLRAGQERTNNEIEDQLGNVVQELADHRVLLERALPGANDSIRRNFNGKR
jgi:predicted  nucleic acid-binding Zn-ribbon protein